MQNRWGVLALVVVARTAMGFQFQSVAAVGPFLVADLGLSYAQLGTLIGLYLLPGVVLALPGGLLGARFGDRAVVLTALGLMTLGSAGLAVAGSLPVGAAGRLVSGAGGVLLTIQATKIVTDWFAGRELATALGIMLAAWPLGIALGLAALGTLAAATTWRAAILVATLSAALAFLLMLFYRERPVRVPDRTRAAGRWWTITGRETALIGSAGLAWATLNAGFILFLSFGPKLLAERGTAPAGANLVVSWASFLSIATVPLGGALLDRVRRRDAVIAVGLVGAAATCGAFALGGPALLWSALVGLLVAPAAGVVALPGEVLPQSRRGAGFGLFYVIYYVCMGVVPVVAGYLVDRGGGAAALWLAAFLWLAPLPPLWIFRALQRRWSMFGAGAGAAKE
ncbi:MAG: MFS transporter [Candidatus Rokuibacteriota bacterium]